MTVHRHAGPVNPKQVCAALGIESCTVRLDDATGESEVEVDDAVPEAQLATAVSSIVYEPDEQTTNRQTLEDRAATALAGNAAFLALPAPTQAQTLAQVKLLTKECSSLIRLALGLLDSTDGT